MRQNPCYGGNDRNASCHAECESYKSWRDEHYQHKSKIDKDGENTVIFPVDLYSEIKRKFAYTNGTRFRELKGLEWVCIEAEPNTVFYIKDTSDKEKFIINYTGILNLEGLGFITGLEYEGVMNPITKKIEAKRSHFLIDYMYYIEEGTYS